MSDASATPRADLRIINKNATPEEVAAIVAVLASFGATTEESAPRSTWAAYGRRTRPALRPGPGAWRASGLPR
jgi:Acyl-CoA carboxylase epsilon subunit